MDKREANYYYQDPGFDWKAWQINKTKQKKAKAKLKKLKKKHNKLKKKEDWFLNRFKKVNK